MTMMMNRQRFVTIKLFRSGGTGAGEINVEQTYPKGSVTKSAPLLFWRKLKNVTVSCLNVKTERLRTLIQSNLNQFPLIRIATEFRMFYYLDALANGEITQNEHYLCIMGPGGPSDTWDLCTASCICDQPWCDCTPPEDQTKDFYPTLKEISFTCYVRPDEDIPLPV